MSYHLNNLSFYLSPLSRGADDQIKEAVLSFLEEENKFFIASQQFSDEDLTEQIIRLGHADSSSVKVFIESKYLRDWPKEPLNDVWENSGYNELNRQCLLALLRSGIEVRSDFNLSALQHANFITAYNQDQKKYKVFITSANFSPGSLGKHLNWGLKITSGVLQPFFDTVFSLIWDGNFENITESENLLNENENIVGEICCSSTGGVLKQLSMRIKAAQKSIDLAYFNITNSTYLVEDLAAAIKRGVTIRGVVDGDQGYQSWNAIPKLQSLGAEIKYYPGALTGALGRMHYKMMVVDKKEVHLGTANLSSSAKRSLEIGIGIKDDGLSQYVSHEIERLEALASKNRLPVI